MDLSESQPTITKEQIEAWRKQRLEACMQQIKAILQEYDCALLAVPQITDDGRITAVVRVEAK